MPPNTATPKPTPKNAPKKTPTWVWISAVAIGLILGYFLIRKGSAAASSSPQDGSGNGAGLPQSGSDSGGGGGSISALGLQPGIGPGDQPPSGDTSIAPESAPTKTYSYINPLPGQTSPAYFESGSQYFQQSSPGSDYYVPLPPSHPGTGTPTNPGASQLPDAFANTNIRRPGFQPDA